MAKVLIVDDDREVAEFLVTLLELEGIESLVAPAAPEAKAALEDEEVALVLLDVAMPGMDGIELCRQISGDPKTRDVPIIVVSARPGRDVVERSLQAGAREFVRKPFENQELIGRIRRLL